MCTATLLTAAAEAAGKVRGYPGLLSVIHASLSYNPLLPCNRATGAAERGRLLHQRMPVPGQLGPSVPDFRTSHSVHANCLQVLLGSVYCYTIVSSSGDCRNRGLPTLAPGNPQLATAALQSCLQVLLSDAYYSDSGCLSTVPGQPGMLGETATGALSQAVSRSSPTVLYSGLHVQ